MHRWTAAACLLSLALAGHAGHLAGKEETCKPEEGNMTMELPVALPMPHTRLGAFNGITYYYSLQSRTWIEAMDYCRSKDQYLLTASGKAFEYVVNEIRSNPLTRGSRFWLAATDFQLENHFLWVYTGAPTGLDIDFSDKGKKESCLAFSTLTVYDYYCAGPDAATYYKTVCQSF